MERILRRKLRNGGFKGVTQSISRKMSAVRGSGNKSTEAALRLALVRAGISGWKVGVKGLPGRPDFFFAQSKLAVFVDGCFWHGCRRCGHFPRANKAFWRTKILRNRFRDRRVSTALKKSGVRVFRFWEHQLSTDMLRCIERIRAALRARP